MLTIEPDLGLSLLCVSHVFLGDPKTCKPCSGLPSGLLFLCYPLLSATPPLTGVTCSTGLHVGSVWDMPSLPLEKHYLKNILIVFILYQP